MKTLILLALVLGIPVAAMGANPTLTNFNARHFIVDPLALPTNVITLHLNSEQFDTGGSDITITNVFGPGTTNIFQTFITTNITAVTEYVTNLYVTYLVSSNSISGNIQGTPPHLSMFFPDNFSLADSIITQNSDTNGVTVNGTGDGSVTLGPSPGEITMARVGSDLQFTNAAGMFLKLGGSGNLLYWGNDNSNFSSFQNADHSSFGGVLLGTDGLNYLSAFSMASTTVPEEMQFILNVEATNLFYFAPRPNEIASPAVFYINSLVPVTNALLTAFANRTTNLFGVTYDGKIQVGGSATNLLYRDAADLYYANLAGISKFIVQNGSTGQAVVEAQGSTAVFASGGTSTGVLLRAITDQVEMYGHAFFPVTDLSLDLGTISLAWATTTTSNLWVRGFADALTNYSRLAVSHTGTNGYILISSQSNGTAGVPRPLAVDRNLGAIITTGDTTFVDMFSATQTNSLAGALTFAHATNGMDLVEFTHRRYLFNSSGADRLITLPAGWHNVSGQTFTVTNGTMAQLNVTSWGDTSTSARQTNVMSAVTFLP